MMQISVTVNDEHTQASIEPRLHLADFLREHCNLTGTHLGCEHGVCGACTVLLNDVPVRSCLTRAVACDGAAVRTVEGFPDDAIMMRLRDAFTREHALQCGFCTPGMLIAAYDLVRRVPNADETRIRTELAGNICRCTGYMGIVAAIKRVAGELAGTIDAVEAERGKAAAAAAPLPLFMPTTSAATPATATTLPVLPSGPPGDGWTRVAESFSVKRPPEEIWSLFGDVRRMAACLPGASIEEYDGRTLRGRFRVRLGPIQASFVGSASLERDDACMKGRMTGGGDEKGTSRAEGTIVYSLQPQADGRATLVSVVMDYRLQGALAQFGRSGIVRSLIGRTITQFAQNIAALAEGAERSTARHPEIRADRRFDATVLSQIKAWLAAIFRNRGG